MKKYKIIDKKRFTTFMILSFIVFFLLILVVSNSIRAQGVNLREEYYEHYVGEGDTIWDIALKYKPVKYDVREMVYEIKKYNNMNTSYIFPGEVIRIPAIQK